MFNCKVIVNYSRGVRRQNNVVMDVTLLGFISVSTYAVWKNACGPFHPYVAHLQIVATKFEVHNLFQPDNDAQCKVYEDIVSQGWSERI